MTAIVRVLCFAFYLLITASLLNLALTTQLMFSEVDDLDHVYTLLLTFLWMLVLFFGGVTALAARRMLQHFSDKNN